MKAIVANPPFEPNVSTAQDPVVRDDSVIVDLCAAALTKLDVAVAEGRHYFTPKERPFVVGRELVGRTADGQRRWFNAISLLPPYGSMAERTLARANSGVPVPDGISDAAAAAIGNAGLAAWLPLSWRAKLRPGETVLILGATGVTGGLAVSAAKHLGAGRIVAAGRRPDALEQLREKGATDLVRLDGGNLEDAFRRAAPEGVDIVLDYLNGAPAEAALTALGTHGRMVQIGSGLGPGIHLPAQLARKQSIDVLGFAYYHAPLALQAEAYGHLCALVADGTMQIEHRSFTLSEFGAAWAEVKAGSGCRPVVIPEMNPARHAFIDQNRETGTHSGPNAKSLEGKVQG